MTPLTEEELQAVERLFPYGVLFADVSLPADALGRLVAEVRLLRAERGAAVQAERARAAQVVRMMRGYAPEIVRNYIADAILRGQ